MTFRYEIRPEKLVHVVFEGDVTYDEEAAAFKNVMEDERLEPDSTFLVDRTRARMQSGPDDADAHLKLIQRYAHRLGRPKMAMVVGRDYDFGMMRVLESKADSKIDHDFMIFRTVVDACEWLGIAPTEFE